MRDNPLHQRVFGTDPTRLEPLLAGAFADLLQRQMATGRVLGALADDELVGVVGMAAPGACQPSWSQRLAMLNLLVQARALHRLPRIVRWLWHWARLDPTEAHWHLGPAAVVLPRQGQGIGTRLLHAVCSELDQRGAVGYLETDKAANVRLYRRGDFEVVAERQIVGVANWFMTRRPAA